jgi:hypothetical protein
LFLLSIGTRGERESSGKKDESKKTKRKKKEGKIGRRFNFEENSGRERRVGGSFTTSAGGMTSTLASPSFNWSRFPFE